MMLWLYHSSNNLFLFYPFLIYLTFVNPILAALCQYEIKHFPATSLSSHPVVQKDVNVTISMIHQLQNINPF